jgi:hypothetical protein
VRLTGARTVQRASPTCDAIEILSAPHVAKLEQLLLKIPQRNLAPRKDSRPDNLLSGVYFVHPSRFCDAIRNILPIVGRARRLQQCEESAASICHPSAEERVLLLDRVHGLDPASCGMRIDAR